MKIHNAISLLELQCLLLDNDLAIGSVGFVASAGAWRVFISRTGHSLGYTGIGRDIGEALKNAFEKFERSQ